MGNVLSRTIHRRDSTRQNSAITMPAADKVQIRSPDTREPIVRLVARFTKTSSYKRIISAGQRIREHVIICQSIDNGAWNNNRERKYALFFFSRGNNETISIDRSIDLGLSLLWRFARISLLSCDISCNFNDAINTERNYAKVRRKLVTNEFYSIFLLFFSGIHITLVVVRI